ncbi:MAG: hypothetical protein MI810_13635 [Flavobacteriales bacterium]|nr:hypothetical protein [Flavobacteriales bacterium]
MAWNMTYQITNDEVICDIELTNGDQGKYKEGSYLILEDTNNELLQGINLNGYNPNTDRLVLLIVDYNSDYDETDKLKFKLPTHQCPGGAVPCKYIFGVVYLSSPISGNLRGPKKKKRTNVAVADQLG